MKNETPELETPMIGWREWLSLPGINVPGIKAKIDTGARSSALHTHAYEIIDRDGVPWVKFSIRPITRIDKIELECEAPVHDFREVKDSGGHAEKRPFIRTEATIGDHTWEIDLSLTNRERMKFRMLLGREALAGDFNINPASSYLLGKSLAHEYRV